jgi:hypothetical protein
LFRDTRELAATIVVKQFRASPLVKEKILVAVVVIVAPHRAHRNARSLLVNIRNAQLAGHIFKAAVAGVSIQTVLTALTAVGEIDVLPTVTIKIDYRSTRAHRGNLRHDVIQLLIQRGSLMNKGYA